MAKCEALTGSAVKGLIVDYETTHKVAENERLIEVWVSVSVRDDARLNRFFSDGDLDAGRFDAQKLELSHVANAPTHDLRTRH